MSLGLALNYTEPELQLQFRIFFLLKNILPFTDLLEFLPIQEAVLVEIKSFEGVLHPVSGGAALQV